MSKETFPLSEDTSWGSFLNQLQNSHGKGLVDYVSTTCGVAINAEIVDKTQLETTVLANSDEIAILPPVSSG